MLDSDCSPSGSHSWPRPGCCLFCNKRDAERDTEFREEVRERSFGLMTCALQVWRVLADGDRMGGGLSL